MIPEGTVEELLAQIDNERAELQAMVAATDESVLSHSRDGAWSVVENLRHLLFSEQGLGRYTSGGIQLSPLGYPPPGLWKHPQFAGFRFEATPTAAEVIAEWESSYAALRHAFTRDDAEVRLALGKYLRHLRNHVRQTHSAVRSALRSASGR